MREKYIILVGRQSGRLYFLKMVTIIYPIPYAFYDVILTPLPLRAGSLYCLPFTLGRLVSMAAIIRLWYVQR